jgi:hypothetical protein
VSLQILDIYQLSSLAIIPRLFSEDAPTNYLFDYAFLRVDFSVNLYTSYIWTYWIVVTLILLWHALQLLVLRAFSKRDFRTVNAIPGSGVAIVLLTSGFNLLLSEKLITWLACTTNNDLDGILTLDFDERNMSLEGFSGPDAPLQCWDGMHQHYGVWALLFLCLYQWSTATVGLLYAEDPGLGVDLRFTESFVLKERIFKLMFLIITIMGDDDRVSTSLNAVMFGILCRDCFKTPTCKCGRDNCDSGKAVCNVEAMRLVKSLFYAYFSTACVVGFFASLPALVPEPEKTWVPFWILVALILVITACWTAKFGKELTCGATEEMSPSWYQSHNPQISHEPAATPTTQSKVEDTLVEVSCVFPVIELLFILGLVCFVLLFFSYCQHAVRMLTARDFFFGMVS